MMHRKDEFEEPDILQSVAAFHRVFNVPIKESPAFPDKGRSGLRVDLMEEELDELKEAIEREDLVAAADALCDLQYVLTGTVLEFGLGPLFNKLFEAVHRSNMSKASHHPEKARKAGKEYLEHSGIETKIVERQERYIILRKSDGKVLKSLEFEPPDFTPFLEPDQ